MLQNPESLFYKMVQQLGKGEAAALTETAKQVSWPGSLNYSVPSSPFGTRGLVEKEKKHCVPFSIISLGRRSFNTSRVEVRSTRVWQDNPGKVYARVHVQAGVPKRE